MFARFHATSGRSTLSALLLSVSLLGGTLSAQGTVPSTMPFQGRLALQSGTAVNTMVKMSFSMYAAATGGTALWTEVHNSVSVTKGLFKVELGTVMGFPPTLFTGNALHLGIRVGTDSEMVPRVVLSSQAYAQLAKNAQDVKGQNIHPKSVSIGTTEVINAAGQWVGSPTGLVGPTGATGPQGDVDGVDDCVRFMIAYIDATECSRLRASR